ncbi:tetratricopeptide repeat protein [Hydrogenobacter hydrogenophilus]|uniref:Tetratricopeptide repeat-containing protein n=1 Tax=Hydrogenobacter hydrogenophilus TaxID=35835 RepID=A0A285P4Z0_9AQUI|nr:tetratricopeptide repeat protein [Hydrogenobacter hydrogenophilus]SNZ16780.1 Tetratricopeptide repeat-containing protein [Hydrogenobacter hydrogenophilus]
MKKFLILTLAFVFSCGVPRIVILEDSLSAQEHLNLGYIYEKKGDLKLAKEEYKKAIQKDKGMWEAYFNLGNVYAKEGNYKKAEEEYRKALRLKPQEPDILNNLAWVLFKQGRKEEALSIINQAISIRDKQEYRETLKEIEGH